MTGRKFNEPDLRKATRMITNHPDDLVFGIACYEGAAQGDEWVANHAGIAKTDDDAEAWLRGEDVVLMRVYDRQDHV
jgi:hypothetical protein